MRMKLTLTALLFAIAAAAIASQRPQRPPVQKVRGAAEIRATTAEERTFAEFFDVEGESIFEHPSRIFPKGDSAVPPPAMPGETRPIPTRLDRLRGAVCANDAVITGHATSRRAILNKSETHLITIFSITVEQWLRPTAGLQNVDVGRGGGEVEVSGKLIGAPDESGPSLADPYVFFLKRLRGQAFIASGFLAMTGEKIGKGNLPSVQKENLLVEDFLREIRSIRCEAK